MLVENSYSYIKIGLALRLLRNVSATNSKDLPLNTFKDLQKSLEKAEFAVSVAATTSQNFGKMMKDLEKVADEEQIGAGVSAAIHVQATNLENIVFAEAITKKLYVLPSRRFNADYLLNSPAKLLKVGAFEKIEKIAQDDIASSCKCILFGEATAAAFHVLRATESVLKTYYFHHRRQKRLSKPMWGNMTDQLKAKKQNRPADHLLQALDLIRTAYRNPTQHPEASYEIDAVQDLFGVCLDVIGKMSAELPDRA